MTGTDVAAVLQPLDGMTSDLGKFYKDLHQHPELSFQEDRTAAKVAERLRKLEYDVTTGIGGTGVVGMLRNGAGPTVLLRADMDALPVKEKTGLAYASKATGKDPDGKTVPVMHACGHDTHVTCLLGAADLLTRSQKHWSGTIMAVFQPAEEVGGGAKAMINDGLFDRLGRPTSSSASTSPRCPPAPSATTSARPSPPPTLGRSGCWDEAPTAPAPSRPSTRW